MNLINAGLPLSTFEGSLKTAFSQFGEVTRGEFVVLAFMSLESGTGKYRVACQWSNFYCVGTCNYLISFVHSSVFYS